MTTSFVSDSLSIGTVMSPNVTVVGQGRMHTTCGRRLSPEIVTSVPPVDGPELGLIPSMTGEF